MSVQKMPGRILLVDDESMVRESIARMLSFLGYQVVPASSSREALSWLEKQRFELVITDYSMPDMNGDVLGARIKALKPGQPVLLISGYVEHLVAKGGLDGVDLIIGKPFEIGKLRRALHELCKPQEEPDPISAD